LTVWYLSQSPEEIAVVQEQVNEWAKAHPGVTIDFSPYGFEDMNKALKLALDGKTGPDVAYASPGPQFAGAYFKAGHLKDLTELVKSQGWDQRFNADVIDFYASSDPAAVYGMPYDLSAVGVFYNKKIFDDLGIAVPTTFAEFEDALAKIKAAELTPISVGGQDKWPLFHIFDQLVHGNTPFETLTRLQNLDPQASWNIPEVVAAAEKVKEWNDKGYFNEDPLATSYDDANNLFLTEEAAINIGGTWNNGTFIKQAPFEVGFFALPQMNPDLEWHMGGFTPNNVWIIPTYSKQPDLALELVDYMLSEKAAQALWDLGDIVAFKFATVPPAAAPLQTDVYNAMQATGTGFYSESPAGEIGDAGYAALQDLVAGNGTAAQVAEMLQQGYEKALNK
jgi:raffinose/stachyose/melibiose transport system substrate-binding protein